MKRQIGAKIVADSIDARGCRLTTFIVEFPRFILAELNTHRMLSRNSASSRARPFKVMLRDVTDDPFVPIRWMAAHKGMQGTEYLDEQQSREATQKWLQARDAAVAAAVELDKLQVTKQFVNRLLEPFLWHQVVLTASDWENFFALRAHADAEIHIQALAHAMLDAYNASTPKRLAAGEWHIPFGDHMDEQKLTALVASSDGASAESLKKEIACARCARLSYKPFGSEDAYDYAADRKLFKSLVDSSHFSPLEHVARAMTDDEWQSSQYCGNFRGFVQYRKLFLDENRRDARVVSKK